MLSANRPHDSLAHSGNAAVTAAAAVLGATAAWSLAHAGMDATASLSGALLTALSVLMVGGWANAHRERVEARRAQAPQS